MLLGIHLACCRCRVSLPKNLKADRFLQVSVWPLLAVAAAHQIGYSNTVLALSRLIRLASVLFSPLASRRTIVPFNNSRGMGLER